MYVIPDEVMERLLRDLDGAKAHLDWVYMQAARHGDALSSHRSARNIIANVKEELATYRKGE